MSWKVGLVTICKYITIFYFQIDGFLNSIMKFQILHILVAIYLNFNGEVSLNIKSINLFKR
jgi:hypothetical protein